MVDKKRIKELVAEHQAASADMAEARDRKQAASLELRRLVDQAAAEGLSVTIDGDVIGGPNKPGGISVTVNAKPVGG